MPNRWNPGCNCCAGQCIFCDGQEVQGISVTIAGLPASAYMEWSTDNFTKSYSEEWTDFDVANGTYLFGVKADPAQPSEPSCFVDPAQLAGTATLEYTDFNTTPNTVITQTANLYVRPNGNIFLAASAPTGVISVDLTFESDLLSEVTNSPLIAGGCVKMDLVAEESCRLKREIASGDPGGVSDPFCSTSPTSLIGATSECKFTY